VTAPVRKSCAQWGQKLEGWTNTAAHPGWLEEWPDLQVWFCTWWMGLTAWFFCTVPVSLTGHAQLRVYRSSRCCYIYTTIRHELRHTRKAWPCTLLKWTHAFSLAVVLEGGGGETPVLLAAGLRSDTYTCRLNMELGLQSLFGLHSSTHWLRLRKPPPLAFGLIYEDAIGQPRETTSLCDPLGRYDDVYFLQALLYTFCYLFAWPKWCTKICLCHSPLINSSPFKSQILLA
jgi:hypothetical protein